MYMDDIELFAKTEKELETPQGANYTVTYHQSRKIYKLDEPDMPDTAGEARTRS